MRHVQGRARRVGAALAAVVTWAGLLAGAAGCTSDGGGGLDGLFGKPPASGDVIRITPDDGSKGVRPDRRLRVRVPNGRLESVKVVKSQDARETPVRGRISDDGLSWEPADRRLALAAEYTVDAVALDGHGRRSARHAVFTTYVPEQRFVGYVTPEDRAVVGTGMIVSVEFSREVTDRAAVERAIEVSAEPAVEIRPHWFGDGRLDFRPERYWKPGTEVTVALHLRDVQGAPGVYGLQDRTYSFTVGRSQVSLVDAARHTMQVRRDGQLVATVPVTAGAPKTTTYNGKMVVMEMLEVTRMNGATVGFKKSDGKSEYDIPDVPHAIRLTDSGTFLHGNYWADRGVFGQANTSHGCVGLRDVKGGGADTPAGWFFDRSLVGDVVEVVHSKDKKVAPDNGLSGWNMGWGEWKEGSALS
ncbi:MULTISPECIES: Ig-like domain-containing protein [unclassified Streptomyces]|uniref:L,D-transpeptidase n=1 Tax=unclassified Streptomyces TaxID=2593676 RepID=UPI001F04D6FB|nr:MULTISPECIES: Ig-like domain-containing protein [unclassified Streptomyces]MCH0567341.1 L,D-transpeptidase family protein [Streptomyces sp. MUM 2J]MCH0573058.1 L,D-transpeptidase family protein [Streptomyces sp. MUM 136J]